jgi:uncharacterized HAD superfamily protein
MVNGQVLEVSIEKLKYIFNLNVKGFEITNIEIDPSISNNTGKLYNYNASFNLLLNSDNGVDALKYNLTKVSNVLENLLQEYSLSEKGKLVFNTEKDIVVNEPYIVSVNSEPWSNKTEMVLFFTVDIDI